MGIETLIYHPWVWRGRDSHRSHTIAHATGFEELDRRLPGGGWPTAALTEIVLEHYGIGELSLLMPALAHLSQSQDPERTAGWILWICPPFIPYAPALCRHGIDLDRMLVVHAPARFQDSLWAVEQALRTGSCAAVLAWVRAADDTALRRLQLAAEQGGCWAVLFRPVTALRERSPSALRIRLQRDGEFTRVEILKCRGAQPGVVHIQHDDLGNSEWW